MREVVRFDFAFLWVAGLWDKLLGGFHGSEMDVC